MLPCPSIINSLDEGIGTPKLEIFVVGGSKKEKRKTHYRVEQQHVSVGSYLCVQQFCSPIISVTHRFPTEHCEVEAMPLLSRSFFSQQRTIFNKHAVRASCFIFPLCETPESV